MKKLMLEKEELFFSISDVWFFQVGSYARVV